MKKQIVVQSSKKNYQTPKLQTHGGVEKLTLHKPKDYSNICDVPKYPW